MPDQETPLAESCKVFLESMAHFSHVPSLYILKLGRAWRPRALPADVEIGPAKRCYENAGLLALDQEDLTYVEGYACPDGLIPVHHAWCVTKDGDVIDNTFKAPEKAQYYGVPFSTKLLRRLIYDQQYWGLLAEHISPELLDAGLADLQAGDWPPAAAAVAEIEALLAPYRDKP